MFAPKQQADRGSKNGCGCGGGCSSYGPVAAGQATPGLRPPEADGRVRPMTEQRPGLAADESTARQASRFGYRADAGGTFARNSGDDEFNANSAPTNDWQLDKDAGADGGSAA